VTDTIQQNRYDQLLRRVGGIIGPGSKVGAVVGDLFPMLDVERVPGELLALMGTHLAWGGTNQAGFAALTNQAQLFNPVDSGLLITVTRVDINSSSSQPIGMGVVTTFLTPVPNEHFRDGRLGDTLPAGQLAINTAAAADPANQWVGRFQSPDFFKLRDDNGLAVLSPGTGLQITSFTVNTTLQIAWMWRERPAEQSELNL